MNQRHWESRPRRHWESRPRLIVVVIAVLVCAGEVRAQQDLVDALKKLDARIYPANSDEAKALQQQLGKWLRTQRDQVNRRDIQAWEAIRTKEDWEHFRDLKIGALRKSLGTFPPAPKEPSVHVTKTIPGDGFVLENLVYESRPDLWVTANLYRPAKIAGPHPGILIIHSHHNPKTQGELQDMGMTWARAGCYVLVPDQLGHGERRQHPFVDAKSYPEPFKVGRQDYHFRYNVAMHLHLIGESLIGWMANDMIRGVDLLYSKPGIDKKATILLGSVAGGGDPAGVTAALDSRITAVAPFNFGGPQPETKFPLPADAKQSFNYMGGGSWESTRGLRLSGRDGFLPWVIVGSVAPRGLIHAHEFAWDQDRDPVWARYQQIFKFYGASDKLSFTKGAGAVTGSGPGNTHCNNIGAVHRKAMHPLFEKWFGIKATEYSKRLPAEELQCLTPEVRAKINFTPVHVLAGRMADEDLKTFHKEMRGRPAEQHRKEMSSRWEKLLSPPGSGFLLDGLPGNEKLPGNVEKRVRLVYDGSFKIPVTALLAHGRDRHEGTVIAVAQEGVEGFVKHRHEYLAHLLREGFDVLIPELPGCGQSAMAGDSRGRTSASTSVSATAQMFGRTLMGLRVVCLSKTMSAGRGPYILWGDSFAPVNSADTRVDVPYDAGKMPHQAEPLGPTLALLAGAFLDEIQAVYTRRGLVSFRALLDSPFVYVPHDAVIPGALLHGDLDDLARVYLQRAGTRLWIDAPVDGFNRAVTLEALTRAYPLTAKARGSDAARLRLSVEPPSAKDLAAWIRSTAK